MNKKTKKITAYIVGLGLLAAAVVFFTYYKVDSVQVRGTTHYSDEEVKKMGGKIYYIPSLQSVGEIQYRKNLNHFFQEHNGE